MMKPKFDDVIEYVRAGEVDAEMAELLDLDPDGQELLKQARFICKALRDRYGDSGSGTAISGIADAMEDAGMFEAASERISMASYESLSLSEPRRRRSFSWNRLFGRTESDRQDLGTLTFVEYGEQLIVSYQPSDAVASYAKKFGPKLRQLRSDWQGIQIHSMSINIALPDSIAVGEPVTLQLSSGPRQMPVRYRDLVFMPDAGPFVRIQSDDQGNVGLPEPIRSGILRIESDAAQFLRIDVKES